MPTIIKEARLIMTDVGENNNKFYYLYLYDDDSIKSINGRVGVTSVENDLPKLKGISDFDKQLRSKIKKGYSELKTVSTNVTGSVNNTTNDVKNSDLHSIAKSQLIKSSNPTLERLIKRFVDANVHKITSNTQITYNSSTGLFSTPLGIVEKSSLDDARCLLSEITPLINNKEFGQKSDTLLSKYLRLIPQDMGMKRFNTQSVIPDNAALQKQLDLINSLESSYQALQSATPVNIPKSDKPLEEIFKVDLDILTDNSERSRLERNYEQSKKSMHNYNHIKVREIFKIKIYDMDVAFNNSLGNIEETYHGTSQANCLSILKCGLKMSPPSTAVIAGALFGTGIYGAKSASKSLGYSLGRWSQGGVGDAAWLFVCSFAMGKTYETNAYGCSMPSGYDSIWAKASSNGLHNDELIVRRNNQVTVKYLLECK